MDNEVDAPFKESSFEFLGPERFPVHEVECLRLIFVTLRGHGHDGEVFCSRGKPSL